MLEGKKILLGITGGISAYKICNLIRMFKKNGADVQVIATPNALNFVTRLTLQTLSGHEVKVDEFNIKQFNPEHISFADASDIFVIAPATANTISKIAVGVCDNLLTSIACAFTKPIVIAPAMNKGMWNNPAIVENIITLKKHGISICEPESGFLACGCFGVGRLCKIEKIFDRTTQLLKNAERLKGKKFVITAGGTREKIDSVRYISNYSSGKMGIAFADIVHSMGAETVLITTVHVDKPYKTIMINSAKEMLEQVQREFKNADCIFMAAAVADYRAKEISNYKIKKTDADEITLNLVKNPDILKEICKQKKENQTVIGFCAESENLLVNAKEKIEKKGCDYLVANDISRKDTGFSSDYNEVLLLNKNGNIQKFEKALKTEIAQRIVDTIWK
ncbi:MAG: bifunctional phosphopantothenoylcysteine decarboxylase/phosphopantothenate--cysteine ligase CoaBC [Candidatus Melainabacteria bacterium]|nr:MAG: bifunctional phosphopantothenoylcysteine decarboxylase/phosphopantothenate--cysteine ligase CoaBC [Candidatus Melainabacteria bacterium]